MLQRIYAPIERALRGVEETIASELHIGVEAVDEIGAYAVKNGGKRIRPAVFLLAAGICGADKVALERLAAAIEMLHCASLLHDDIVDDATKRRGRGTVRVKWGDRMGVLIGDLLWARALGILIEAKNEVLVSKASDVVRNMIRGELIEFSHVNDMSMTREGCLEIMRAKTAELFSMAASAGAIVSGVSAALESALSSYGLELGLAFQLVDDVLDYTADEEVLGKSLGQDLREGRLTYPLVVALERATQHERSVIKDAIVARRIGEAEFSAVSEIIKKNGGIDEAMNLSAANASRAKERLLAFKPSIERDALAALADYLVRDHVV
jgi:octaprenyl-diphosphate synthase